MCIPRPFYLCLAYVTWRNILCPSPLGALAFFPKPVIKRSFGSSECIHGVKGTGESVYPLSWTGVPFAQILNISVGILQLTALDAFTSNCLNHYQQTSALPYSKDHIR